MSHRGQLEQQKSYIIESYKDGISTNKLAKEFNCNSGTIYYFLQDNNVTIREKQKYYSGDIEDFDDKIITMYNSGSSCGEISRKLGPSIHTIIRRMKQLNLDTSRYNDIKYGNLLKDKWETVEQMFTDGISCRQIGKQLGHAGPEVAKLLKKHGYKPSQTKYTIDESFFETINTQEKAYTLGFLYADGNVRDNCFRWNIQKGDKDILEKIAKAIQYTGPIPIRYKSGNRQPQASLYIGRKKMAKDLCNLGCVPTKSLILRFPTENMVPKNLLSHFMRGYFDGDGHLDSNVGYTGSYDFITESIKYLPVNHTAVYQRYKDKPPQESAHTLHFNRNADKKLFLNWIYQSSTIHMDRKYQKYLDFCEKHGFDPV